MTDFLIESIILQSRYFTMKATKQTENDWANSWDVASLTNTISETRIQLRFHFCSSHRLRNQQVIAKNKTANLKKTSIEDAFAFLRLFSVISWVFLSSVLKNVHFDSRIALSMVQSHYCKHLLIWRGRRTFHCYNQHDSFLTKVDGYLQIDFPPRRAAKISGRTTSRIMKPPKRKEELAKKRETGLPVETRTAETVAVMVDWGRFWVLPIEWENSGCETLILLMRIPMNA